MKVNFMLTIAAIILTKNVIAVPVEDIPVEVRNETQVHTVELEHGQVNVHHGRFRVRLNFKTHNSTSTVTVPLSSHSHKNRTRNRG
jgi:hypothetical protein